MHMIASKKILLCVVVFCWVKAQDSFANELQRFVCPRQQVITEGLNKNFITHKKVKRRFVAQFPNVVPQTRVGVIFSWHGSHVRTYPWLDKFNFADYSTWQFPFIVITPEDTGLMPLGSPKGFSWDIFMSVEDDENLEAMLVESVLGCLRQSHNIDDRRIYSAGFSSGALVSNMLHSRYPSLVAAVYSGSGAWVNDPRKDDLIHAPLNLRIPMRWPALEPGDHGAILMSYGGKRDVLKFGLSKIVNFHDAALSAQEFLPQHGRTVMACDHEGGHTYDPIIDAEEIVKFFSYHKAGESSPFAVGERIPGAFTSCKLLAPQTN